MNINDIIDAVIARTTGWQQLLADNWECILKSYPQKLDLLEILANSGLNPGNIGAFRSAYGAGTAYQLTNTAAAIVLGTTSPSIVIPEAGVWLVQAQVHLARNGATVTTQTATLKVRRTNNTAGDVGAAPVIDLPASTTLTDTLGVVALPPVEYTTANNDDALTIFGSVNTALGAGTLDAVAIGTSITALRIR